MQNDECRVQNGNQEASGWILKLFCIPYFALNNSLFHSHPVSRAEVEESEEGGASDQGKTGGGAAEVGCFAAGVSAAGEGGVGGDRQEEPGHHAQAHGNDAVDKDGGVGGDLGGGDKDAEDSSRRSDERHPGGGNQDVQIGRAHV